jgi:glycosyltransferase involved in cell wall biosynthesis
LVYLGKFAPRWNTEAMTKLPQAFKKKGLTVEVNMVGDKIHDDRTDPDFANRMRAALEGTKGVIWHGGMGRASAMNLASNMHFGLSWRDPSLDNSLELSTKVLEFGLLGLPPILNRTQMHEDLFGADYPLFANDEEQLVDVVTRVTQNPALQKRAVATAKRVSAQFGMAAAVARLREYLGVQFPPPLAGQAHSKQKLRILLVSHDWKFFTRIERYLRAITNVEVRADHWQSLNSHEEKKSRDLVNWADVVICEWAGPNAVWYSRNKRSNQRLVVRLHRFELGAAWLDGLRGSAVDKFICVSEPYARQTIARLQLDPAKLSVIPNYVDDADLDRPKLSAAKFHLGLLGAVPKRKRLDRALDVLEELRSYDDRYLLMVKSEMPWDLWWVWRRDTERDYFARAFGRINNSPDLRGGVVFDAYGPDVSLWLRRVGWVLSTSEDESFHLAPAEGMASGAAPLITGWEGSDAIYSPEWIFEDTHSMAKFIRRANENDQWLGLASQAKGQVIKTFGLQTVLGEWRALIEEQADALGRQ